MRDYDHVYVSVGSEMFITDSLGRGGGALLKGQCNGGGFVSRFHRSEFSWARAEPQQIAAWQLIPRVLHPARARLRLQPFHGPDIVHPSSGGFNHVTPRALFQPVRIVPSFFSNFRPPHLSLPISLPILPTFFPLLAFFI